VDLGIKTEQFVDLSRAVCAYARHTIPSNRPIVGERLYDIESGIIASWVRMTGNDKLLAIAPFRPELVGQHPVNIVMGKNSGIDSIATWLDDRGLEANEDQRLAMVSRVKEKALEKKGLLTEEEFMAIYKEVVQAQAT
jgi:isopropylmalate/homocitrate/citramalate synthase